MIRCTTNLDWYKPVRWPVLKYLPNIGDAIQASGVSFAYCTLHKIPTRLKVVSITHMDEEVVIELWYFPCDINLGDHNHLMKK